MATSPNYGWSEPDNTSLVKDGAQAMRTLGDAIDTSLWNSGFGQAGKNKIINGDFGIWQRGTSITIGVGSYWADRYSMDMVAAVPTGTASRQAFTPASAPVAGYESSYFGRINITAHNNCTQYLTYQRIEDVRTFAGQTVTISAWLKADAATNMGIYLVQNFGSGGSGAVVTTASSSSAVTTGWVRYSWTIAVPSISGKTIGTGSSLELRFVFPTSGSYVRVGTYDFWGVQLEAGSIATPFQTASGGSIQSELAMCQRYYPVIPAGSVLMGYAYATNGAILNYTLPVTPRVAPTGITTTAMATFDGYNAANSSSTPSSITTNSLGQWGGALLSEFTCTAATPVRLVLTTGTIGFTGCEL